MVRGMRSDLSRQRGARVTTALVCSGGASWILCTLAPIGTPLANLVRVAGTR
jgi:hypothetical protein